MSKVLTFGDGTSIEFADSSIITDLVTVVNSCASIDPIRAKFTEDNLIGATFDGEDIENLVPVSFDATADIDQNITVHFNNRFKTDVELLQESQAEQNDVLNFLLMNGGE